MNSFKQIYEIVLESIKDDAIIKFSKMSAENQDNTQKYVNKFWNEIRNKETDPQKKDINYWLKVGFPQFANYVDTFKSEKDKKIDSKNLTSFDHSKGKLLEVIDDYELWQVDSYNASKYLGREYKNSPTKWCISSNSEEHWHDYYIDQDKRFYFLISRIRHPDLSDEHKWDKIAIAIDIDKKIAYWDLSDNRFNKTHTTDTPIHIIELLDKVSNKIKWYNIEATDDFKKLIKVTEKGLLPLVKYIIENNKMSDFAKNSALITACEAGHFEIVKYLVENGAKTNTDPLNADQLTPLTAAMNGSKDMHKIVKYLVEHGANINSEQNELPVIMAMEASDGALIRYFVEHGLNIHNLNEALRTAVRFNDIAMIKYLLANEAEIIAVSDNDMKHSNEETKNFIKELQDKDETHI